MSVALVARDYGTVEHLGVWAYSPPSEAASYATGRYVPICGQERVHDRRWLIVDWLCTLRQDRLNPKPLCTRCTQLLADLNELAEPRPAERRAS